LAIMATELKILDLAFRPLSDEPVDGGDLDTDDDGLIDPDESGDEEKPDSKEAGDEPDEEDHDGSGNIE